MKGQYVAVETMLSFAVGLVVAFGIISIFASFRGEVVSTAQDNEIDIIHSRITDSMYELDSLPDNSSGYKQLELPENLGGRSYQILLDDQLEVVVDGETYNETLRHLNEYSFRGQVDGGTVTIYKRANQFILRPGR